MTAAQSFETIRYEVEGRIGILSFNRPEVRNAIDQATWSEVSRVLDLVEEDPAVGVLVITGAGEKAFASGADIRAFETRTTVEVLGGKGQRILARLEEFPKPVIAAINGYALGGGCEVAMACDIRIASDRARFGQPEVNLGLLASGGGTQRLARLVGLGKALELLLTGEILDAAEAERIGLVNKVVAHEELFNETVKLSAKLLSKGPMALWLTKMAARASLNTDLHTGLLLERVAQAVLFQSEDRREGVSAFLQKRVPQFRGR